MAIVSWSTGDLNETRKAGKMLVTWAALANGDTGQPFEPMYRDATGQIFGTFGAGGSVTLQGSNDPRVLSDPSNAVWVTIQDSLGNAWTKTAAGGDNLLENYRFIRPNCTAGDGTTALTIIVNANGDF